MPIDTLSVVCAQLRRDLLAIAKFLLIRCLTLYAHIQTTEQRTIIQQYGDQYTGRW